MYSSYNYSFAVCCSSVDDNQPSCDVLQTSRTCQTKTVSQKSHFSNFQRIYISSQDYTWQMQFNITLLVIGLKARSCTCTFATPYCEELSFVSLMSQMWVTAFLYWVPNRQERMYMYFWVVQRANPQNVVFCVLYPPVLLMGIALPIYGLQIDSCSVHFPHLF